MAFPFAPQSSGGGGDTQGMVFGVVSVAMHEARYHIVLYNPAIPQNTGSIARLCAGTGAILHLIHPLGFDISAPAVKRAGLDYWPHVDVREHPHWDGFLKTERPEHLYFFSKFSTRAYTTAEIKRPCYLVFGNETSGLPSTIHTTYPDRFFIIPIRTALVRSLNLAQCAAIVLYEALRQNHFEGIE